MTISDRFSVPLLLSIGVVVFLVPWLFFGFHYSDIGWNASKSWLLVEHPSSAYWEFSWLSSFLAGLWMQLTEFSLFWLRVGFIVCGIGMVLLTYAILRLYYNPKPAALAIVPAFLLFVSDFEQFIPNYYSVPPLFALSSMFFHLKSFRSKDRRGVAIQSLLAGVFFALAVQSRIPALALGLVFLLTAIVDWYYSRSVFSSATRLGWTSVGFIVGTGGVAFVLFLTGNLGHAIDGLLQTYNDVSSYKGGDNIHHPLQLLADTAIRYGKIAGAGLILLFGAYVVQKLLLLRRSHASSHELDASTSLLNHPVVFMLICLAWLFVSVFLLEGRGLLVSAIGIVGILFVCILIYQRHSMSRHELLLYVVALVYMVCMNLGSSNSGTGNLKYTMLLLLPVVLVQSKQLSSTILPIPVFRLLLYANILVMFFTTRFVYHGRIVEERAVFQSPALAHIRSTEKPVQELDRLLEVLADAGLKPGDTTLCYVDIPLLHFVTQTIPALKNPWISDRAVGLPSLQKTREVLREGAANGTLPAFVIRGYLVQNHEEYSTPKLQFLDSLWQAEDYDTLLRTEKFTVLKRP